MRQNTRHILQILDAEKDKLFQYASYRLHEIKDVEDVLQNTYMKTLSNEERLKDIANLRAYFYRMVSNECSDIIRERSRTEALSADAPEISDIACEQPENFEEEFALINRLLNIIPFEQSEIIRFRLHSNLTFQEIADVVEVPLPTVKARFRYGIEKIKTQLKLSML